MISLCTRKAGSAATITLLFVTGCDRTVLLQPNPVSSTVSSAAPVPSGPITGLADAGVAGELTLLEPRHGFGVADVNGDAVDDVVAIAHVETSEDSERRLVAFDGKTRGVLWKSAPLRPWSEVQSRARTMVLVGGGHIAVSTGWTTVDFYDLKSGTRKKSLELEGVPGVRSCSDPKTPSRYYLELSEGGRMAYHPIGGAILDVATMTAEPAAAPTYCLSDWVPDEHELSDCHFRHSNELARAQCVPMTAAPKSLPGFQLSYALTAPEASLAIGNAPGTPAASGNAMVVRFDPGKKKAIWTRTLTDIPHSQPDSKEARTIHQIDVTAAGVVLLLDVLRGVDAVAHRLVMLDTNTGATRFDREIASAGAFDPRVVGSRLYVPKKAPYETTGYRPNGQLFVFDASTGTPLFSLGGGEKF